MSELAFQQQMQAEFAAYEAGEAEAFFAALQMPVPTAIRLNPLKTQTQEKPISLEVVAWSQFAYYLEQRPAFIFDPRFHAGAYYVQDASCMVLEALVQDFRPRRVLDLCAAPGGKSTHLASLFPEAMIVANDVIRSRAKILQENLSRWGSGNLVVTQNDPADFQNLAGFFDLIIVDAPCSGEGLCRKNPAAQSEWSPEHVKLCAARQQRILGDIWSSLAPGGTLVYATCTYNSQENMGQLDWLCQHLGAEPFDSESVKQLKGPVLLKGESGALGVQMFPQRVSGDGFFMGWVQKPETERVKKQASFRMPRPMDSEFAGALPKGWKVYLDTTSSPPTQQGWPDHWEDWPALNQLRLLQGPLAVAEQKGKVWRPLPDLALSGLVSENAYPRLELPLTQALQYLKGEALYGLDVSPGYLQVCFQGWSLGWIKQTQQQANNFYPHGWRIRKNLPSLTEQDALRNQIANLPLRAL